MRVLVTGGNGFVGGHLIRALRARGDEVVSAGRSPNGDGEHLALELHDTANVREVVERVRPELVFHLAAQAFVPEAVGDPLATYDTNVMGTARLVEALRAHRDRGGPNPRLVVASSAEVYGIRAPEESPLRETLAPRPVNPYGASKAGTEAVVLGAVRAYGLDAVIFRGFNQIGPGQDPRFVVQTFARQLATIAGGAEPVLRVGNLEAQRDFLDVRDAVRAYVSLGERGIAGEIYNVCSGKATAIHRILTLLIEIANVPVDVQTDPERMRPSDAPLIVGDPSKVREQCGWQPEIELGATLRDVYREAFDLLQRR